MQPPLARCCILSFLREISRLGTNSSTSRRRTTTILRTVPTTSLRTGRLLSATYRTNQTPKRPIHASAWFSQPSPRYSRALPLSLRRSYSAVQLPSSECPPGVRSVSFVTANDALRASLILSHLSLKSDATAGRQSRAFKGGSEPSTEVACRSSYESGRNARDENRRDVAENVESSPATVAG